MEKRGQVTIFIVVGIIIIVLFAGFFFMRSIGEKKEILMEEDKSLEIQKISQSLKSFVESCISKTTENGLIKLKEQGGFYNPLFSTEFNGKNVPYYMDSGIDLGPSKDNVEQELSSYIDLSLELCLNNFNVFIEKGIHIERGEITSAVQISNNIKVDVKFPVTLNIGGKTKTLSRFQQSVHSDFNKLFQAANSIRENQLENPVELDISYLIDLGFDQNVQSEITFSGDTVFVALWEEAPAYNQILNASRVTHTFNFALGFDWEEQLESFEKLEITPTLASHGESEQPLYQLEHFDAAFAENPLDVASSNPEDFMVYLRSNSEAMAQYPEAYETAIAKDPSLINGNMDLLQKYFEVKGAPFSSMEGTDSFTKFDGEVFSTKAGNQFTVEHILKLKDQGATDFKITNDGKFVYTKSEKEFVVSGAEYKVIYGSLGMVSGSITTGDFSAEVEVANDGIIRVQDDGSLIVEGRVHFGDIHMRSGKATVKNPSEISFEPTDKPVEFTYAKGDALSTTRSSKNIKLFLDNEDHTDESGSYIQITENSLRTVARDENDLRVIYNHDNFNVVFTDSLQGIITLTKNTNGDLKKVRLDHGKITYASPGFPSYVLTALDDFIAPDEGIGRCNIACVTGIHTIVERPKVHDVDDLIVQVGSASEQKRVQALLDLGRAFSSSTPEEKSKIIEIFRNSLNDENVQVRVYAAARLGVLGDGQGLEVLQKAFDDSEASVRRMALRSSARIDPEITSSMIEGRFFDEKDAGVRVTMVSLLKDEGMLRSIIENELEDLAVRRNAIFSYAKQGNIQAMEPLVNNDKVDPNIRGMIYLRLPEDLQAQLTDKMLSDPRSEVRRAVAYNIRSSSLVEKLPIILAALANEQDPQTKKDLLMTTDALMERLGPTELQKAIEQDAARVTPVLQSLSEEGLAGQLAFKAIKRVQSALPGTELSKDINLLFLERMGYISDDKFEEARAKLDQLSQAGYDVELKDIPLFLDQKNLPPPEELRQEIRQRLSNIQHTERASEKEKESRYKEHLHAYTMNDQEAPLKGETIFVHDTNLLKIKNIMDGLQDPEVRAHVGNLIQTDVFSKPNTEVGGYMDVVDGKLKFVDRPPEIEKNNGNYEFTTQTLQSAFKSGMGLFHLHAVDHHMDSSWGAGPSGAHSRHSITPNGDLGAAQELGIDGVVVTSIGPGKFNVDYYTPDGVVIDLGNYDYSVGPMSSTTLPN